MGNSFRKAEKLECISALTDLAVALATGSSGHAWHWGNISARYSSMARESQTMSSPFKSTGTLPPEKYGSSWVDVFSVHSKIGSSLNGIPACFMRIHGLSDQDE
jgi:hypothetical protein